MSDGGPYRIQTEVVIGLKDVYDAQVRAGERLLTLEETVRAATRSSTAEWAAAARIQADHETRIRRVERWVYALPVGAIGLLATATATLARR